MVQFHLGENSISFSDDFDKLNALRGVIADGMSEFSIYDTMAQLISKHGRMPDVDEFASVFPLMINKLLYEVIVPEIVDFLVENEIYDCSEELFVRKYQENYFDFAKQPQFQNFISHYTDLTSEYMEKRTQKAYDRANRSRWMGGGFGIKGAIKGAAQAAVLNVATGAVRGIGDGIRSMETLKMVKPMALDWFIAITNLSLAVSSKKESPAAMELFSTQIFRMLALFMKVMIAQPSRCLLSITKNKNVQGSRNAALHIFVK